ncbi:MAG: hypothetical protein MK074_06750 [Phycisphaerales bacterium]|nr:hypothetical protein [Phycisphaerales bacterium]
MANDRVIQGVAMGVILAGGAGASVLVPDLVDEAERHTLRYTDTSVENVPPIVALGTAIGALRGLIVDYLWIKVNMMQDQGLYYDMLEDARLITKLQPRFAPVWTFHGHNMAYNLSVNTNTPEERWEWVRKGIALVRDEGLRYNPNDILLYRDLAFWHDHKIEGVSDDAHPIYKREFAKEWHDVLGQPPLTWPERTAWMQSIADAPDSVEMLVETNPDAALLVDRLNDELAPLLPEGATVLGRELLRMVTMLEAINGASYTAQAMDLAGMLDDNGDAVMGKLDALRRDPELAPGWDALLATLRKEVLQDQYNMDPQLMAEYTRDFGPIDWRHPQAHALYWSRTGGKRGERRVSDDDDHHAINTDRQQLHSLQDLARGGRVMYDPFSPSMPGRFPEPDFIDTTSQLFDELYVKYNESSGMGGETFLEFIKNFLGHNIRVAFRQGETERAEELYDLLDRRFGRGAFPPNPAYSMPLDVFVREIGRDEYDRQPYVALSDVIGGLRYAFRVGVGQNRPEIYEEAIAFANDVTEFFRTHEFMDFETKMGTGRMRDLVSQIGQSAELAFLQLMTDPSVPIEERATIWAQVDDMEPQIRMRTYDRIRPWLDREISSGPLRGRIAVDQLLPEPPGMEAWRAQQAAQAVREAQEDGGGQGAGVERTGDR